jgi:hypothetical protein
MQECAAKFQECYKIFRQHAFKKNGEPRACDIHDVFDEKAHNCLGCNFAESSNLILRFLKRHKRLDDVQHDFAVYILLMYLLVERIEVVLGILGLPKSYKDKHFKVFEQVRKWANFIKHPGPFILTHHPVFVFDGPRAVGNFDVMINEQFVETYYKGYSNQQEKEKRNMKLRELLRNNDSVMVVYPDIAKMTTKLCYAYAQFVAMIMDNSIYRDILEDEATLYVYFENSDPIQDRTVLPIGSESDHR